MDLDLASRRIDHRYELVRVIGAGGMATVLEAVDTNLDKRVAVKILNRQYWHDPILVARFQREARAMAKVRHPNLIDVTHHGLTDEGMPFLVMEYLEGWDLLVELRRLGAPMPWERTVELALQMCAGLSAAHSAGIVHRDIKPSNCFLARSGDGVLRVKLLDLGIAKLLDADQDPDQELTKLAGGIPGTLHYMAPEQIRGEAVDPRTDLYSVGIVLYRMLAGELPFVDRNDATYELMRMQCEDSPRPPREAAPEAGIPAPLEAAVLKAMEKDPDARWQSAAEFAAALRQARAEASRAGPQPRRRPVFATSVVLALFVLLLGLLGVSLSPDLEGSAITRSSRLARVYQSAHLRPDERPRPPVTSRDALVGVEPPSPLESAPIDEDGHQHPEPDACLSDGPAARPEPAPESVLDPRSEPEPESEPEPVLDPRSEPTPPPRRRARKKKPAAPAPSPAALALMKELSAHHVKFRECRGASADDQTVRFSLTLEPRSGNVLEASPESKPSAAVSCAQRVLKTMHFHSVRDGGRIESVSLTF